MSAQSWLSIPAKSHFSLANIPFGIITTQFNSAKRPAVAVGNHVLDLQAFTEGNGFAGLPAIQDHLSVFSEPTLNAFAALGRPVHRQVREYLRDVFSNETSNASALKDNADLQSKSLVDLTKKRVKMHLPMRIGDYTDFFAGRNHAFNVGTMFRGPANALQPNYNHIPVGYHGRASSVVISGTRIRRPLGQILEDPTADPKIPTFTACKRLDMELELGAFLCSGNEMGESIPVDKAEENLFGLVLMNDWSARDIQTWEYVPLGPFNAKNFGTTISPWVVLADALEPFRTKGLVNDVELQPYLKEKREDNVYDIQLEVDLTSKLLVSIFRDMF
jgi:fumarylacetoacetase